MKLGCVDGGGWVMCLGRLWVWTLAALACGLVACGGGTSVALWSPGTGGTGVYATQPGSGTSTVPGINPAPLSGTVITAIGPVRGFGSVIVNGIRFDDSNAQLQIDGYSQAASQLRLGMVATITGVKSSDTVTSTAIVRALGTAQRIEVWSIAQGTISSIVSSSTFKVAGMTMVVNANTVFDGVTSAQGLSTQSQVKLWGQPLNADFSQWAVTRLELVGSAAMTVSTGKVLLQGGTASLNGLVLTGSEANVSPGLLVRAVGNLASNALGSTLTVTKITPLNGTGTTSLGTGYAEIEGFVTSVLATTGTGTSTRALRLSLGNSEVDLTAASVVPANANITQGTHIEVQGNWVAGVLVATRVEVQSGSESQEVEIESAIEQFTSVSNFIVRGQRCDASGLTRVSGGRLTDLRVGLRIHLHGLRDGDVVRITELEIK